MPENQGAPGRERWWSPAWVAAIATAAGVIIAGISLFLTRGGDGAAEGDRSPAYFMYGTAMPGHLRYPAIDQFVASTAPDTVAGRLFDTGAGYPAAKFGGTGRIRGYVLRIVPDRAAEAAEAIANLEGNLFRPANVETESGVDAVAYEFVGSTEGMTPIGDGTWRGDEA